MVEARITSKTSFAVRAASLTFQLFCLIQHGRSKLIICSDPAEMFSIDVILRKKKRNEERHRKSETDGPRFALDGYHYWESWYSVANTDAAHLL